MQGQDKGLISLNNQPMVAYVLAAISPQVDCVIVSANRNHAAYQQLGELQGFGTSGHNFAVVGDQHDGFAGPLAGIYAGLAACGSDLVFTCPCDSPFIGADIVTRLVHGLMDANADIAIAHDGRYPQPVFAVLRRHLHADLADFLKTDERKIMLFYRRHHWLTVNFSDQTDRFVNINTYEERDSAEQLLSQP